MFKDELNIAFENVRPSPELLDRVSAMMSEEVNRKKAPIQMRAVRYAGIAAAVALAAGGTLLIVNNANNNIKTSSANYAAAAAAPTAEPEAVKAEEAAEATAADIIKAEEATADYSFEAEMPAAEAEEYEDEIGASLFIAAAEEADVDMRIAAAGVAEDTLPAETLSPVTTSYMPEMTSAAEAGGGSDNGGDEDLLTNDADAVTPKAFDMETYALKSAEDMLPAAMDEEQLLNDCEMAEPVILPAEVESIANDAVPADDADMEYMPIAPTEPTEATAIADNSADEAADSLAKNPDDIRIMYNSRDYVEPCIQALDIRPVLIEEVGKDKFEEWQKSFGDEVPDSITGYTNLYTMIKKFELPKEKVASLVGEYITAEQLDLLYNGTVAEITAAFASEFSIVKDEKIYSPQWIKTHTEKDYEAAGISGEDLLTHDYVIIPE